MNSSRSSSRPHFTDGVALVWGKGKPRIPKVGNATPKRFASSSWRWQERLASLGIKRISRQTVRNILKEESIPPQPDRPTDRWDKFLRRHGESLWGCDFFTVRTITRRGIRQCYLLVFLNLKTREAIVSPATEYPNSKWVCRQATAFIDATASRSTKPSIVLHDRDTKFTRQFKDTLKNGHVRPTALPKVSPNLNGRTERFGGSLKRECLSKFIFFGKQHLDYVVSLYVDYYNEHRAHSARDNLPPIRIEPPELEKVRLKDIQVKSYVGGLISSSHTRPRDALQTPRRMSSCPPRDDRA